MTLKYALLGIAMLFGLTAAPAQSATLTGDSVDVTLPCCGTTSGTVGAGYDVVIVGSDWDFNGGVNGDVFSLDFNGSYCGLADCAGTVNTFTLSSLNFSGGASLIGFTLLSSVFTDVSWVIGATSIVFTYTEQAGGPGTMLSGVFITDASPVPVPAALPLLAAGLCALGFAGWRRTKTAPARAA